jgi:four helix bundle protein
LVFPQNREGICGYYLGIADGNCGWRISDCESGTSIGANYREANRAQSHDDFIHKLALCEKEAAETEYWLELALEAKLIELNLIEDTLREVRELLAIFVARGKTAKSRR